MPLSQPPTSYVVIPPDGSDLADEWIRQGYDAQMRNDQINAERSYRQALRVDPRSLTATNNLAIVYAAVGDANEALLTLDRAALFDGSKAVIHCNRSLLNLCADRIGQAVESADKALSLAPPKPIPGDPVSLAAYQQPRLVRALIAATSGRPEDALPLYSEILEIEPNHPLAAANTCFVSTLVDLGPEETLKLRKRWYKANRYTGAKKPHDNNKSPNRRLKVGYVSGDFKRHSASMIFGSVLNHHDSAQIEAYYYSTLPVDPVNDLMSSCFARNAGWDGMTLESIGKLPDGRDLIVGPRAPRWRHVATLPDDQLEDMIRRDGIDILVDLSAHTAGGRLSLFTRKPSPVQVTAWGFAHGTGCDEMDYFLADLIAVPLKERKHYAEKVVDLPCIVTYEPPTEQFKGTSQLPFYRNDYMTFGCYARYEKYSDACMKAIGEILRKVKNSRVEFKDYACRRPHSVQRVVELMPAVAQDRLLFSLNTDHADHLRAYQQADLMLEPWPHGAGTTCLEALYMGVPMLARYGLQPSGRSLSSVYTAMGKSSLGFLWTDKFVAKDEKEYVQKAVALASDPAFLQKVRRVLRGEFLGSPVVKGYAKAVETVYREIWKDYCKK